MEMDSFKEIEEKIEEIETEFAVHLLLLDTEYNYTLEKVRERIERAERFLSLCHFM
jgi:hypothetical protein